MKTFLLLVLGLLTSSAQAEVAIVETKIYKYGSVNSKTHSDLLNLEKANKDSKLGQCLLGVDKAIAKSRSKGDQLNDVKINILTATENRIVIELTYEGEVSHHFEWDNGGFKNACFSTTDSLINNAREQKKMKSIAPAIRPYKHQVIQSTGASS